MTPEESRENSQLALMFLEKFSPAGPWALTAIRPDKKGIETKTFGPNSRQDCLGWIIERNGKTNLYFHVNPVIKAIFRKAERKDIRALAWLHVDIDPRPGKALEEEQQRALNILSVNLPQGVVRPTCVLFSGGGYQAFWRLSPEIELEGKEDKIESATAYNMQLERLFGGDHCHNIDRVMRLPYTLNIPDDKKTKKGRKPVLAKVLWFEDTKYDISKFIKAQPIQDNKMNEISTKLVEISGNIARIDSWEELDRHASIKPIPDDLKVIIAQGRSDDPAIIEKKQKNGDTSRSAWLFDVCCNLTRCGVSPDVIYAIITDEKYGISESVLEWGPNADGYARRQITRAIEYVKDPDLQELNDKFALIRFFGSRCRIAHERFDNEMRCNMIDYIDLDSFKNILRNRNKEVMVNDKPALRRLGEWWLDHPQRREFDNVVFAPGKEVTNCLNLWRGFAYQAVPGECNLFLDHLKENVCQGIEDYYLYLINWFSRMFQHPATQSEVAVVLKGGQGTGKSFVAHTVGSLLGRHYQAVSNPTHIIGKFNAHLRDCLFLFGDEAFMAGDRKAEAALKTLITGSTRVVEGKGVDAQMISNYIHLMLASNHDWVVQAGEKERRFFVLDVGTGKQQNNSYFAKIEEQLNRGGREALLYFFLTRDIAGFKVQDVPQTNALQEQKLLSNFAEHGHVGFWHDRLGLGESLPDIGRWVKTVKKADMYKTYVDFCQTRYLRDIKTQVGFGKVLRVLCPSIVDEVRKVDGKSQNYYILPSLKVARKDFEKKFGTQDWDNFETEDAEEVEDLEIAPF